MKKAELQKTVVGSVMSLGLVVGLASFAGAAPGINATTGPDSTNTVEQITKSKVHVENNNDVSASNDNHQNATTGEAEAEHNTKAGSAKSGNAANANALNASVAISNTGAAGVVKAGTVAGPSGSAVLSGTTGPDSTNTVKVVTKSHVMVTNNNNISVSNSNNQTATSGEASVEGNTTGGSATSGNATNTNSTTMNFKISN